MYLKIKGKDFKNLSNLSIYSKNQYPIMKCNSSKTTNNFPTNSKKDSFSSETQMDGSTEKINSHLPTVECDRVSLASSNILSKNPISKSDFILTHPHSKNNLENSIKNIPKNQLRIFHLNPRSIVDKLEHLLEFVQSNNPDLLFMTETWMDNSVAPNSHLLDGYKIIRHDRPEKFN